MVTAYLTVTVIAIAANGFSGVAALAHFKPILPGMERAGVPLSWLTFPIGTLKTTGALGLAAGLSFRPFGVAAAVPLRDTDLVARTRRGGPRYFQFRRGASTTGTRPRSNSMTRSGSSGLTQGLTRRPRSKHSRVCLAGRRMSRGNQ